MKSTNFQTPRSPYYPDSATWRVRRFLLSSSNWNRSSFARSERRELSLDGAPHRSCACAHLRARNCSDQTVPRGAYSDDRLLSLPLPVAIVVWNYICLIFLRVNNRDFGTCTGRGTCRFDCSLFPELGMYIVVVWKRRLLPVNAGGWSSWLER